MDTKTKYIAETEEQSMLIEAIENAIITAVKAGHDKEEIEHAIAELWYAI